MDLRTFTVNEKQIFIFYQLVGHNNPKPFLSPWRPKTCNLIKNPECFFYIRMYIFLFHLFLYTWKNNRALQDVDASLSKNTPATLDVPLGGFY